LLELAQDGGLLERGGGRVRQESLRTAEHPLHLLLAAPGVMP
jgi:hypothetical protein